MLYDVTSICEYDMPLTLGLIPSHASQSKPVRNYSFILTVKRRLKQILESNKKQLHIRVIELDNAIRKENARFRQGSIQLCIHPTYTYIQTTTLIIK